MAAYHGSGRAPEASSTTEVARQEAGNLGQSATQAGGQVAQTTKDQVREVTTEVGQQARDLVAEARGQARDQAGRQRDRAVSGLRALGDELDKMAERGGQSGVATEVARQLSSRSRDAARFVEEREPGELLEEVRSFARRRPGVFLLGAALAGVAAGRLTRAAASRSGEQQQPPVAATGMTDPLPGTSGQYGLPTTGQPGYPPAPDEPSRPAAAPDGSAYPEPAYAEPGYGQSQQPQQWRTP